MDDISHEEGLLEIDAFYDTLQPTSLNDAAVAETAENSMLGPQSYSTLATHGMNGNKFTKDNFSTLLEDLDQAATVPILPECALPGVGNPVTSSPALDAHTGTHLHPAPGNPTDTGSVYETYVTESEAPTPEASSLGEIPPFLRNASRTGDPFDQLATMPIDTEDSAATLLLPDEPVGHNLPPGADKPSTIPGLHTDSVTTPQPTAHHLPSSGSKASLLEEMHKEDQLSNLKNAVLSSPERDQTGIKKESVDSPAGTEVSGSEADAPSSPIGLRERFKEVAAEAPVASSNLPTTPIQNKANTHFPQTFHPENKDEHPPPTLGLPIKRQRSSTPPEDSQSSPDPLNNETAPLKNKDTVPASPAKAQTDPIKRKRGAKAPKRASLAKNEIKNLLGKEGPDESSRPMLRKTRSQALSEAATAPNAGQAAKARQMGKKKVE